jgi:hypothetical protein
MFLCCSVLSRVYLGEHIVSIDDDSFMICKKLRKINIENIQSIGAGSF